MAEMVRTTPQFMVTPVVSPESSGSSRIWSVDVLRGLVMVVMALDHTRDYLTYLRFQPEALVRSCLALFFTRWITCACALLFFFLVVTGTYLRRTLVYSIGSAAQILCAL